MKTYYENRLLAAELLSPLSAYSPVAATDKNGGAPASDPRSRSGYNLHWFKPKAQAWRSPFVESEHGSFARFAYGHDRFVLDTSGFSSDLNRQSANDIRPNSSV